MRWLSGCATTCSFSSGTLQVTCSFLKSIDLCIILYLCIKNRNNNSNKYYMYIYIIIIFSSKPCSPCTNPCLSWSAWGAQEWWTSQVPHTPQRQSFQTLPRSEGRWKKWPQRLTSVERCSKFGCVWGLRCSKDVPSSEVQHHSIYIYIIIVQPFKKYL